MRPLSVLFVLSVLSVLSPPTSHAQSLTIAQIDSLQYPPRDTVLIYIAHRQYVDRQLQQHHLRELLAIFARLDALKQELKILKRQQANLTLIHRLNLEKQSRSEISDLDVLKSEQGLLNKRMAIVGHTYQIRETILTLTRLANISIIIPNTSETPQ